MKLNEVVNKEVLTQEEIEQEMREAEEQGRMVDFSNKVIKSFFVLKDKIKHGITFENTVIDGQFFLGEIMIEGDLILKDTKVKGSVYLAKIKVKGSLDIEGLISAGAINLVGAEIGKDVLAQRIKSKGFLSLAKTSVGGNIILDKARIENTTTKFDQMTIRGDLILEGTKASGSINIKNAQIDGMLDLDEIDVGSDLILIGTVFKNLEDSDMHIKGKKIN
ncbi:MAG: hypothetical protein WC303_03465 [Candidatus Paceibacterota bacterium]|jgi:hypothetical protein